MRLNRSARKRLLTALEVPRRFHAEAIVVIDFYGGFVAEHDYSSPCEEGSLAIRVHYPDPAVGPRARRFKTLHGQPAARLLEEVLNG